MAYGLYRCATCSHCYHSVRADTYDPDARPNGTWFRLRDFYRLNLWHSFPENDAAISSSELWCPGCGDVYRHVHERTKWFNDSGEEVGHGPEAFRELAEQETAEETAEAKTQYKPEPEPDSDSGPQVYVPTKKGKKDKKGASK